MRMQKKGKENKGKKERWGFLWTGITVPECFAATAAAELPGPEQRHQCRHSGC